MAVEVIMPQLGMSQQTGVIARWCREVGDQIKAGDIIMEVETDKAVMEVEAREAGCLAKILHEAGAEVPVGAVVAVIDDGVQASPKPKSKPAAGKPAPAKQAAKKPAPKKPVQQSRAHNPVVASANGGDKILASPKAKATSAKLGVSLQDLRDAGLPQPFHHADVEKFATGAQASDTLLAEVDAQAMMDFLKLVEDARPGCGIKEVLCAFAIGAWCSSAGEKSCVVSYVEPGQSATPSLLGGFGPISALAETNDPHVLHLHNMVGSFVCEFRAASSDTLPVLTVSGHGARLRASLRFGKKTLSVEQAIALLESFARRLHDPRCHLM